MANVNLTAESLKRQSLRLSTAYCQDSTTIAFPDNYCRALYGGIQFVGQVHASSKVLFPVDFRRKAVLDESALLKAVNTNKLLAQWLDPEQDYLPVLNTHMEHLQGSSITDADALQIDRVALAEDMNRLVAELREEGDRTQTRVESLAWQRAAVDGWTTLESYITSVAERQASFTAMKICLLDSTFSPADKYEAFQTYEASIHQARCYQRQLAGEPHANPTYLARPDVATVLVNRNAMHARLSAAQLEAELLGHVIFARFSRINGLYLSVLLLFKGKYTDVMDKLADRVGSIWREVMVGTGFHYVWQESYCPWVGCIDSRADAKFSELMLDLKCAMWAERYVRPKALAGIPSFMLGGAVPIAGREEA